MTPASVATVLCAIEIMVSEPERIQHLWDVTKYANEKFKTLGFDIGKSESPIIPLFIRDDIKALKMAQALLADGVFVNPVVSPGVPKEDSLIRFSLMATHTFDQVDVAIDKIAKCAKKLGVINLTEALRS
jgi:7-keto-8-aminopelargonate synthetase-like enzyme